MNGNTVRKLWFVGLLLLVVVVINACDMLSQLDKDPYADVQPTYTSLWESYFSGCGPNCHEPSNADLGDGPDMSSKAAFYAGLYQKTASDYSWNINSECRDYAYIDPANADGSLLLASLIESSSSSFSTTYECTTSFNVHVLNKTHVESENLKTQLIAWINNGADNN
ncbi:MAG: hypothetical protein OEZ43_06485 [Gammaproteobacteria bacterium]|nr:hypothetical protein [Gammaproteobacteria bacterium]